MTLRKIARMGQPVLWEEAGALHLPLSAGLQVLVDDMIATMHDASGVGLAAPQVYESVRLVVAQPERAPEAAPWIMVNPVLEPVGDAQVLGIEGCLSIPDWQAIVPRWERVRYRAFDRDGRPFEGVAEGFTARVLQHEVDHLDGILYPMRLQDPRDLAHHSEARHLVARLERYAGGPDG